ncbi:hypothetical protein [Parafrankia soli]|uniref:hypothetical protein n=1 Tax=Parafrankia soli TaxID=2599596 RepID=UPI0012FF6C86|nr:hypothetical protein [Parafrankia soli]
MYRWRPDDSGADCPTDAESTCTAASPASRNTAVPGVVFTPIEENAFISAIDDEFTQ